jgi:transposase
MDEATYREVFGWVLRQVRRAGLLKGETIGIDATYLKRLAEAAAVEASDESALRRMDRQRKKKGSNADWVNPHDSEAEITRR